MIREVKQALISLNLLIGLRGLSIKIIFLELKVSKWSIETHTILIREVKKAQIRLNLLIGLKGIKGIKYKKSYFLNIKCQNGQYG